MPTSGNIRGAVFEVLVSQFAKAAGYTVVASGADPQLYKLNGLPMVHGLGEGHNADVLLDAPVRLTLSPQTRLLVECKGYADKVGLPVIRGALGLRVDLNAFRKLTDQVLAQRGLARRPRHDPIKHPHYHIAVASLFGFTANAQSFAATHHIELLDYSGLPILGGTADLVASLHEDDFPIQGKRQTDADEDRPDGPQFSLVSLLQHALVESLSREDPKVVRSILERNGIRNGADGTSKLEEIANLASNVRASYTATLSEGLHVHLLGRTPLLLPPGPTVGREQGDLQFMVRYGGDNQTNWWLEVGNLQFEFALPKQLIELWKLDGLNPLSAIALKEAYFSTINLVGPVKSTPDGAVRFRHIVAVLDRARLAEALRRARGETTN